MSNRLQRVNLDGDLSNYRDVNCGVPQGSVLGPVLFSIYINNLANQIGEGIQMYADDTVLFSTSPTDLRQKLELAIDWCTKTKFKTCISESHA